MQFPTLWLQKIEKDGRFERAVEFTSALDFTFAIKLGTILGLMDKHKNFLVVGDEVRYGKYKGIILYEPERKGYGVAFDYNMWYGNDKYNIDSYGKFIDIPMDNGARMEIELISHVN